MSSLREAQKRMTRELLLREGLRCFEAKGYGATTIDDIAAAAGTTRTTFYLHFPSKAQLLRELIAVVDTILTTADDPPLAAVIASGDRAQIRTWLSRKIDQWPEIRPYVTAAHEAAASDAEIREAVDEWFESAIGDIENGLDRADRFEGSTRRIRGVLAFGQLEFSSVRWMRRGWDVGRDEALDLMTDAWCALLAD
ncbi:TetR/AcrR family transcriptional regulator [Modestobacter lapidis]|nr:TetR/AcrR family transcriptional regulator [Modestobacter lapidis]